MKAGGTSAQQAKAAAADANSATAAAHSAAASAALAQLQFGATLYNAYTHLPEDAAARLPLTRYADYLHHFGFNMERESGAAGPVGPTAPALSATAGKAGGGRDGDAGRGRVAEGESSHEPIDLAGWGIAEALRTEADQRAAAVGPLREVTAWTAIAAELVAPFTTVTWRQTATQCTIKKARCVYAWLYSNMTLVSAAPPGPADEAADGASAASNGSRPSSQHATASARKSAKPGRKVKEIVPTAEPTAPPEPLEVALQTRRATAAVLAEVYARMLGSVGVTCEEVPGQLKGAASEEAFEWRWNLVVVEGRQYLVDVSAALSNGVLRPDASAAQATPAAPADGAKTPAVQSGGPRPGAGGGRGKGGGAAHFAAAAAAAAESKSAPAAAVVSSGTPQLLPVTPAALRCEFFFFAHPGHFLVSHLPTSPAKALVRSTVKALQWGVQPRLTPAFFHFGLQLNSHPTHGAFVTNGSPSYISFVNRFSSGTELCCVLYVGTLRTLPEDLSQATPLGAEWVWHQREESADTDTFTLTVPQAGYYVAVIGARPIRADPYSAVIAVADDVAFTPVVTYEMRVGFTPSSAPVLPRQYLSPSICRLMTPLCAQLAPGRHVFRVMPSCSNVVAVAVVKCVPGAATAAAHPATGNSGAASAAPGPAGAVGANSAAAAVSRSLHAFLTFQPRRAVFDGTVELRSGEGAEVWVLYGAPDRNGQQLSQRIAAASAPAEAVSPSRAHSRGSRAGSAASRAAADKKKGDGALEQQRLHAEEAQLAQLLHGLQRGEVFQRAVGGIEVRHFVSPVVMGVIQPQPSVEQEHGITLRRLAGVTSVLLGEAGDTARYQPVPVGGYFGAVAAGARA